ncbi:MAG: shikimate kinase, partial [Flavobacteriales bacterium]|nr:shikimate kinase [Flavobacteriales bacterium]
MQTSKKIFLIGFMGSGKTTIGKKLANKLTIPFFDIDEEVVNDEGKDIPAIFENNGENYFRQKEHEKLTQLINKNEAFVISTGGGTPCFNNNMELMNANGTTIYLKYTPEFLVSRLKNSIHKRPLLQNISLSELNSFITSLLAEREFYYSQSHF